MAPELGLFRAGQASHADHPLHHTPLNPSAFLLRNALIYPHKLALTHPETKRSWTSSQWSRRVSSLAHALVSVLNIRAQHKVAVLAPNVPLIADLLQACPATGIVLVPINTRLTVAEVEYILDHSDTELVFVDEQFAHLVKNVNIKVVVSRDGREGCSYEGLLEEGQRVGKGKGWEGIELIRDENAVINICYTSGTTGRPKGVVTTHRGAYLAAVANVLESGLDSTSVYLWILPMFHAAGWTFPWACTAAMATQICQRSVGEYDEIWDHLHNGVTHYCGAPTVQLSILNHPKATQQKLPRQVNTLIAAAAPTATLLAGLEQIGIKVTHVYGLTETYGPFMRNYVQDSWKSMPVEDRARMQARQGHAYFGSCEAKVMKINEDEKSETLQEVAWDGKTTGEIVLRGNLLMKEYYKDPEATRKAFTGGYFHTGDVAVRYPDGSVHIQDRSKDIIISGGENASSLFIESELSVHPDVLEVAVVARAHPKYGERAHAFVVLRPISVQTWSGQHDKFEQQLKQFSTTCLPGFARPEWVQVVDQLDKTSTGKVQKFELRKRLTKL